MRLTASLSSARKTSQKRSIIPIPRTQSSSIARGWHFTTPLETAGGTQKARFITEPDVYRLITHSKLPNAQRFEAWVFEEVLPSIRRTGGYVAAKPDDSPEEIMARAVLVAQETIERQKR